MDIKYIQKHVDRLINEQNNRSLPEFEGYSPLEMQLILYEPFNLDSPIQWNKLKEYDYKNIPLLNQIKYLANLIAKSGEITLTSRGFLPTKVVSDIYGQGFIKEQDIESGISKLYKETDAISINLTRILIELSGLAIKRKGKLRLTKASEKILSDNNALLQLLMATYGMKFNWAYYDGFDDNKIGQLGWGFTTILLSKYGNEKQFDTFYAEKYFKAFPQLIESTTPRYFSVEYYSARCYSLRSFNRFLNYFGLIELNEENHGLDFKQYVAKSDLFDRLIIIKPHVIK